MTTEFPIDGGRQLPWTPLPDLVANLEARALRLLNQADALVEDDGPCLGSDPLRLWMDIRELAVILRRHPGLR